MGAMLESFSQWGEGGGWELCLFSSKRHLEEDKVNAKGQSLRQVAELHGIKVVSTENINQCQELEAFLDQSSLGIAIGAAWMFEEPLVRKFHGRLFDFMGIRLPEYRGGAHYTWQILRGDRRAACHLQKIYGGASTFHKGELIASKEYELPVDVKTPMDYFSAIVPIEKKFLCDFFQDLKSGKTFELKALDESKSSYFPFLATKQNGWVNWSWSAEEIFRFIRAFGAPYPGASTRLRGNRVFLHDVEFIQSEYGFHSFFAGLIYRKLGDGFLYIACRDHALRLRVLDEAGQSMHNQIVEGDRLFTSARDYEDALSFGAVYDANGLK